MAQLLRYLRASTGNVSLFLGIAALPLMLSVGVATDMIRMNATRTVLQNAADAAAIAGAASNDKTEEFLLKSVNAYLESNNAFHVTQYVTDVDHALDKEKGTFTVKIKGTIPGSFMSLVGFDDLTVGALSVANMGSESLELALVLDNTGSMAGAKIGNLKTAATNLVNTIITESPDTTNIKMAVVPFAQYVNVGKGNHGQGWLNMSTKGSGPWQGCVGPRPKPYDMNISTAGGAYPALAGVDCNAELLPLTSNMVAVKTKIASMNAVGWTYIPAGLIWGWNVLDSAAPFSEGKTKDEKVKVNGKKAIVLMTDGENTRSAIYPTHNGTDVNLANATLEATCQAVKADGIEVYTVSFMVQTPTVKKILQDCATVPAQFFDADDALELNEAFSQIARELAAVRLSQ